MQIRQLCLRAWGRSHNFGVDSVACRSGSEQHRRAHVRCLRLSALSIICLLALCAGGWVGRAASEETAGVTVAGAPPLGPFLDVWADAVGNHDPAVAYNSRHDEYLVVWWNNRIATRDLYARRVAGDGTLLSSFTIVSNANKWNWLADVVYNPVQDEYFVVYTYNNSSSDYDIWGRSIVWDGSSMGAEIQINGEADIQWYPAVAYNSIDNEYLVVYENSWADGRRDIAAQRIRASDGAFLSWRNIATAANTIRRLPDVAYNEARNEYLIAYTYQFNSSGDGDILGRIASHNLGTLGAEMQIVYNTACQESVALAAGPDEYFATWRDSGVDPNDGSKCDLKTLTIFGRRVSGNGTLNPFVTIVRENQEIHAEADVAYSSFYGYVITWRHASTSSSHTDNVYGRNVRPQSNEISARYDLDVGYDSQRSPTLACTDMGQCLFVEEDNYPAADYEIRGRILQLRNVFAPIMFGGK